MRLVGRPVDVQEDYKVTLKYKDVLYTYEIKQCFSHTQALTEARNIYFKTHSLTDNVKLVNVERMAFPSTFEQFKKYLKQLFRPLP